MLHIDVQITYELLLIQALTVRTVKFGLLSYLNALHLCKEQAISTGNYTQEPCSSAEGRVLLHNDLKKALWGPENLVLPAGSISLTQVTNAWKWFTDCLMSQGVTWCLEILKQEEMWSFLKRCLIVWCFAFVLTFFNTYFPIAEKIGYSNVYLNLKFYSLTFDTPVII